MGSYHCPRPLQELTTFLKQYGERRTGTNYLRALLLANYKDVHVLMHVLGDKHSPPVDLNVHLDGAAHSAERDWQFVRAATLAAPAESTRPDDPEQIIYLRDIADAVAESVRAHRLGYLISSKHPHTWAASLARYSGWMTRGPFGPRMRRNFLGRLANACHLYNQRYRAWLDHHGRFEQRSAIVRYEDLLQDVSSTLTALERKFKLVRLEPELRALPRKVQPADWDQDSPDFDTDPFDPTVYSRGDYRRQLSSQAWKVIDDSIDWSIAGDLGYAREPRGRS